MTNAATLDELLAQSKRARIEAEQNAELARELAKDPVGFNEKFAADHERVQKCPICKGAAIAENPGDSYVCECGWRSDKPNGGARKNV